MGIQRGAGQFVRVTEQGRTWKRPLIASTGHSTSSGAEWAVPAGWASAQPVRDGHRVASTSSSRKENSGQTAHLASYGLELTH